MRGTVETLQTAALTEADFVPGAEMDKPGEVPAHVASGVIAGQILHRVKPTYPAEAKGKLTSGSVVLHAGHWKRWPCPFADADLVPRWAACDFGDCSSAAVDLQALPAEWRAYGSGYHNYRALQHRDRSLAALYGIR